MRKRPFIALHIPQYNPDIENKTYLYDIYYLIVRRNKHLREGPHSLSRDSLSVCLHEVLPAYLPPTTFRPNKRAQRGLRLEKLHFQTVGHESDFEGCTMEVQQKKASSSHPRMSHLVSRMVGWHEFSLSNNL